MKGLEGDCSKEEWWFEGLKWDWWKWVGWLGAELEWWQGLGCLQFGIGVDCLKGKGFGRIGMGFDLLENELDSLLDFEDVASLILLQL